MSSAKTTLDLTPEAIKPRVRHKYHQWTQDILKYLNMTLVLNVSNEQKQHICDIARKLTKISHKSGYG